MEQVCSEPGFWDDSTQAQKTMKDTNRLRAAVDPVLNLMSRAEDVKELAEMVEDENSQDADDVRTELKSLLEDYARVELETVLSGEHDNANAIMEINSGAGGTEACDWVDMLARMYTRWAERRKFKIEILNQVPGEVAGSKNVTILIEGRNAYGYAKTERGVHRLVRISPFDANKRRHTSFAAVDVIPEIADDSEVNINPDEIRIDTYRSSGAGGQHVNKTDSAIRITHIPTGLVVTCQNERSQHKNKDMAMKVLMSRLGELQSAENDQRMAELRGDMRAIEWGNQMRSYVFQPYTMVKDLRTGHETGDVARVMDGDIDDFLETALRSPQVDK